MHNERQSVIQHELLMLNSVATAVELPTCARIPGLHLLLLRVGLRRGELKDDGTY